MRRIIAIGIVVVLASAAAHAQSDFSGVEIKVQKVAGSIYMLQGAGGNIGASVGDDGIVLIDDQFAPLAPKIKAALKGITDKPVRFVLNTHYHDDHTGGNEVFGESAPLVAHDNVRKRLAEGAADQPPAARGALPVVTFRDRVSIHLNGEEIRAAHYPSGHTDGDSVIWFTKSNVVHMGDDFFSGRFPYVDLEAGGSVRGLIRSVETVLKTIPPDAKIIPGHGPLSTVEDLKSYLAMLKDTLAIVEAGVREGKSLDELQNAKVLDKYESWTWNFIPTNTWIATLYKEAK
jgi:glyoxylase-like metal-dependent hydrolase (beta-lactamase superfamily II)